jgi:hypothetical protein
MVSSLPVCPILPEKYQLLDTSLASPINGLSILDKTANPLIFKVDTPLINTPFQYNFHLRGEAEVGGTHLA